MCQKILLDTSILYKEIENTLASNVFKDKRFKTRIRKLKIFQL